MAVNAPPAHNPYSLALLRRWADLLDRAFVIPGTSVRFGLDAVIGLVPGIGDLASPILTLAMLWHAAKLRVPKVVLARMVLNALIDASVGAIPFLGDIFDFAWKSNDWNLALLERHARPGTQPSAADWLFVSLCAIVIFAIALLPVLLVVWIGRRLV
jgi:hypothetical protein